MCLRQQANAHALLSERAEFEKAVDLALIEAATGGGEEADDLAAYCTPSYVAMEAGMSWTRLGHPEEAVKVCEDSLVRWPEGQETRPGPVPGPACHGLGRPGRY